MEHWTAGDYGGTFAAVVAGLVAIGKFVERRVDGRAARLQAWEGSLAAREKEYREQLEGELKGFRRGIGSLAVALFDVTLELKQHAPQSPALARALATLREVLPEDLQMTPNMRSALAGLDALGDPQ